MAKRLFEFYCNDCNGWILVNLNEDLRGEFTILCPECGRKHPRRIENGEMMMPQGYEIRTPPGVKVGMSIVRNNKEQNNDDVIVPMKSAYSKTSRLDRVQNQRTGGLVGTVELWLQHALGFAEGDS